MAESTQVLSQNVKDDDYKTSVQQIVNTRKETEVLVLAKAEFETVQMKLEERGSKERERKVKVDAPPKVLLIAMRTALGARHVRGGEEGGERQHPHP